jgi:hypothetical protein
MLLLCKLRFNTDLISQIVSSSLTIHPLQTSKESVTSGSVYVRKKYEMFSTALAREIQRSLFRASSWPPYLLSG